MKDEAGALNLDCATDQSTLWRFKLVQPLFAGEMPNKWGGVDMKVWVLGFTLATSLVASAAKAASEVRFGSWQSASDSEKSYFVAATSNDSGNTMGVTCYVSTETCYWILITGHACDIGGNYIALVNAGAGAKAVELKCIKVQDVKMLVFTDFEAIESTIRANSRAGIAFPMQDGTFVVMRFSLDGANSAIDHAKEKAAEEAGKSTRDQRI